MGGPLLHDRTSFDRLKALDDFPDLDAQLEEATDLCNHAARAEMILKWLLGKIKNSSDVQRTPGSWDLLHHGVRLLTSQKAALLLKSHAFMDSFQAACAEEELSLSTIVAISRLLRLLLDMSQAANGGHIKTLLSVDGGVAASVCGNWFRHVSEACKDGNKQLLVDEALLDPAMKLWNIRKQTSSDDRAFSRSCFVFALTALCALHTGHTSNGKKRKRDNYALRILQSYTSSLESMVARHVVLSTRAMFFKKIGGEIPQPNLARLNVKDTLEPLSTHIAKLSPKEVLRIVPQFLEIAAQTVPTPTHRQRSKERPWIEALFTELQSCLTGQPVFLANGVRIAMLEVLARNRLPPSTRLLANVVQENALSGPTARTLVEWELVGKVIEVDATVMIDRALAKTLFGAITADEANLQANSEELPNNLAYHELWRTKILIPAMDVYARSRKLDDFIELWDEQLDKTGISSRRSVWTELEEPVAKVLNSSLIEAQYASLIDRYCSDVAAFAASLSSSPNGASTTSRIHGTVVMLNALLRGVQTEYLQASIQPRLDSLLQDAIEIFTLETVGASGVPAQLWHMLAAAFELWLPFWAKQTADREVVAAKGKLLLSSALFELATACCSLSDLSTLDTLVIDQTLSAQVFVTALCGAFQEGYSDECSALCSRATAAVIDTPGGSLSTLLARPAVLLRSLPATRTALWDRTIQVAAEAVEKEAQDSVTASLCAISAACQSSLESSILHEVVDVVSKRLSDHNSLNTSGSEEHIEVSTLLGMSAVSITRPQREDIMNSLLELPRVAQTLPGLKQLQRRLALILSLMETANPTAELLKDPSKMWSLLPSWIPDHESESTGNPAPEALAELLKTSDLFCELIRSVFGSWLMSQDQDRSRTALVESSQQASIVIKGLGEHSKSHSTWKCVTLAMLATSFELLETRVREDLKPTLSHRNPETSRSFVHLLSQEAESVMERTTSEGSQISGELAIILGALVALPDEYLALTDLTLTHQELSQLIARISVAVTSPDGSDREDGLGIRCVSLQSARVQFFQLSCKHLAGTAQGFVDAAIRILNEDLTAKEHATAVSSFETTFKHSDVAFKSNIIQTISRDSYIDSPPAIVLWRSVVKVLSKDGIESLASGSPENIYKITLEAFGRSKDPRTSGLLLQAANTILQEKPFLINQHGIEQTMLALHKLITGSAHAQAICLDICRVLTMLLQQYRSRLQGRYPLLVTLLQSMITSLFLEGGASESKSGLPIRHARAIARLLELFCRPPQQRSKSKSSDLVDEARKAQAQVGQYVHYVLHHYCSQVLTGSLGEGVGDAIRPGLWSVIEAIEVNNPEGIRSLSAAMNNSERAVLRSVYEDWKSFGKWEGL